MRLHGRDREMAELDAVLAATVSGGSAALIIRGEVGIGKTAMLDHIDRAATDHQVLKTAGVGSEASVPYGALHRLFADRIDDIDELPPLQAEALRHALGIVRSDADDEERQFHAGLGVASLLGVMANEGAVVCLLDDVQRLDWFSAKALMVAVRRLSPGVAIVLAADEDSRMPAGIPELRLRRLPREDSKSLLFHRVCPFLPTTCERLLDEADGNPLALLALGQSHMGDSDPFGSGVQPGNLQNVRVGGARDILDERVRWLPATTWSALVVAASDNTGSMDVILPAARLLGATIADFARAERAGVIAVSGNGVTFSHPLFRYATYQVARPDQRLAAHAALADVLERSILAPNPN